MPYNRKSIRLPPVYYLGPRSHFVTICCDLRRPYLAVPRTAASIRDLLLTVAAEQNFLIHAYCVMPDHLHFLAQGAGARSDLQKFVRIFKLRSAYTFQQQHHRRLWEKSYYDHILRSAESLAEIASYIWCNPVRKHLCASPMEFPFSGSQTMPVLGAAAAAIWIPPWKPHRALKGG